MNKNEKQNKDNVKQITIRLDLEMYKEIEKLSTEQERTITDQIRYIIKEYLRIKNS